MFQFRGIKSGCKESKKDKCFLTWRYKCTLSVLCHQKEEVFPFANAVEHDIVVTRWIVFQRQGSRTFRKWNPLHLYKSCQNLNSSEENSCLGGRHDVTSFLADSQCFIQGVFSAKETVCARIEIKKGELLLVG